MENKHAEPTTREISRNVILRRILSDDRNGDICSFIRLFGRKDVSVREEGDTRGKSKMVNLREIISSLVKLGNV